MPESFKSFPHAGLAIDPIHVGTGGSRLGRVDNTIVRDRVTRIPIIPGSSLAGVFRAYSAMAKGKYPDCAGQGQPKTNGSGGHCGKAECSICMVFGFARGNLGGFAGLAGFSDAHVVLFPVASREGPIWVTCPTALRLVKAFSEFPAVNGDAIYRQSDSQQPLNVGWLVLPVKEKPTNWPALCSQLKDLGVPDFIRDRMGVVSDKLFGHVVNSNLEVRTSVSIDPATGTADEGALFTYEAIPRGTVLIWELTCRNPKHFKIGNADVNVVDTPGKVHAVVSEANSYVEHLGIGGMGTRGMGRLRVLNCSDSGAKESTSDSQAATTGRGTP
ncbi:MAG: type III-B CRISPR module RAMP protein Cmr4 [bacterium]